VSSARCSCGAAFRTYWIWPDEEQDNLIHVTDRFRDAPRHAEQILAVSATVLSAGTAGLGAVDHFGAAALLLVALGACQILFSTGCNTTLQLTTPDALRGRVMGLYALANAGMTPFGSLLVGTLAEHLGVRAACLLGGGGGLVAVAVLVLVGRRAGLGWTLAREP